MNRGILIIILYIGIILIVINLTRTKKECPQSQIIYKYIPRTFEEEQNEPVLISDIFKTMFTQQSPWIGSINEVDTRKIESINRYFVSQI